MTSLRAQIPRATDNTFLASNRNPNDNKNRVPTLTELKGLRRLMESNLHVEKVLEDEVARLQSSQKALSEQLIRQQLDLEATQSELFETNNLIESLGLQRSTLQGRTQSLRALIHPIRRLPAEIWKHIFESAVETSDVKLKEATNLSSICRLWREIALDTPRLWCTITTDASSVSKEPWDHWVTLMRSTPANVCLSNICDEDDFQDGPLSKIPNLRTLALNLVDTTEFHNLFTDLFAAQYHPLDELSISLENGLSAELALDSLTEHFPSLFKLILIGPMTFRSQEPSPSRLVTVSLTGLEIDFYSILLLFPLLETLELEDVTLTIAGEPQKVTSNSIRRLKFGTTSIFDLAWVTNLRFPRLRSLFNGTDSTRLFINFVKSHPSIRELDCCNKENEDHLIAEISASSEMTHLSITTEFRVFVDWRTCGLLEVPFPSLQVLMFGDQNVPPDVVEFEGVIRARCLPMNHPMSLLERENLLLKELRVLVGAREWEGEAWSRHALAQEASREIVPYDEIDGWDCVVLRWNLE